jgi:hypothetical protein
MLIVSCAVVSLGQLRLQDRELLIHPDKPGLAYPHGVSICTERKWALRWMGKKCHTEQKVDFYDLNDKRIRENLINAGFSCKSAMRFKY